MSNSHKVPQRRTHGPVDTLADHVSPEWWRHLFDETYLLTDSDVLSTSVTRHEVDIFVERGGLTPEDHILDLCCGQGRHALELARRGFEQVQGIDQSAVLIYGAADTSVAMASCSMSDLLLWLKEHEA